MKKILTLLSVVAIVLGLVALSYGSMKLAAAEEEAPQEQVYSDGDFEFTKKGENEKRADSSLSGGYWLLGIGAVLLVGSRMVRS